jgi:hypothetical protein
MTLLEPPASAPRCQIYPCTERLPVLLGPTIKKLIFSYSRLSKEHLHQKDTTNKGPFQNQWPTRINPTRAAFTALFCHTCAFYESDLLYWEQQINLLVSSDSRQGRLWHKALLTTCFRIEAIHHPSPLLSLLYHTSLMKGLIVLMRLTKLVRSDFHPFWGATTHDSTHKLGQKSTRVLLSWNCIPTLWTLPSCSRKPALFGLIVADFREAWQSVSTISRSKLRLHKHPPACPKTVWTFR